MYKILKYPYCPEFQTTIRYTIIKNLLYNRVRYNVIKR